MKAVSYSTLEYRVCTLCDLPTPLSSSTNPTNTQVSGLIQASIDQAVGILREYSAEQYLTYLTLVQTVPNQHYVLFTTTEVSDILRIVWVKGNGEEVPLELANVDDWYIQPQPGQPNPWTDGVGRPKYRLMGYGASFGTTGPALHLFPTPPGQYTLQVHATQGQSNSEIFMPEGWDQWVVLNTCIMVRARQQKDGSEFWSQLQVLEDRLRKQLKRDRYGSRVIRDRRGLESAEIDPGFPYTRRYW